jgi:hypothetical protein
MSSILIERSLLVVGVFGGLVGGFLLGFMAAFAIIAGRLDRS